jgi:hypothetical protein
VGGFAVSKAKVLIDHIISLPEEATSPSAEERRTDMLSQLAALQSGLDSSTRQEFDEFVHWAANQRYLANGSTGEVLQKMHPRELQLVVQKFKKPGHSVDATPAV